MKFNTYKKPRFENDSMLIGIEDFKSDKNSLLSGDEYLRIKANKFYKLDISKDRFENCLLDRDGNERLALRNLDKVKDLSGTIYTYAAEKESDLSFNSIKDVIKELVNMGSRKAVIRLANTVMEYYEGERDRTDVTCLNLIHYFAPNNVRLVFRASDIKNELFYDIVLVYEFFIKPIFNDEVNIDIYASTCQNIRYLQNVYVDLSKYVGDIV